MLRNPSRGRVCYMVFFNYSIMQMSAKVVYYGPGLCGKTTNLQYIFEHTADQSRGEMVSLATETDRTLFFDLLPLDVGTIAGFSTRIQLYTVPGQVFYNTTRKLVLKGVDGIVFVADSQRPMLQANIDSFKNLEENLAEIGLSLEKIPLVLQYNKRDLPNICSSEELDQALNSHNWASVESSALTGMGVFETLKTISKLTLISLKKRLTRGRPGSAGTPAAAPGSRASASLSRPIQRPPADAPANTTGSRPAAASPAKPAAQSGGQPAVTSTGAQPAARPKQPAAAPKPAASAPAAPKAAPAADTAKPEKAPAPVSATPTKPAAAPARAPVKAVDSGPRKARRSTNLDALAELEKLRKQAFRPKAANKPAAASTAAVAGTAAAQRKTAPSADKPAHNGSGEASRDLQLTLNRSDLDRMNRLAFVLQVEDEVRQIPLSEQRFHVDIEDPQALEKLLLHLNIVLNSR